jgi:hypothetical protein
MKNSRILAALFAVAAGTVLAAGPARAQMSGTAPIVVKDNPPRQIWLKGEVIHADNNSIMVRDEKSALTILTFTYTPELRDKMQQILDGGGYQYGDKVRIRYLPGQTVAQDVRGKPSKPI